MSPVKTSRFHHKQEKPKTCLMAEKERLPEHAFLDTIYNNVGSAKRARKTMICRSKHYPFRKFTNLPRSPIRFDKDRLAEFTNKKTSTLCSIK